MTCVFYLNEVLTAGANFRRDLCLSIGNFDGVHLGHQAMINTTKSHALKHNLASAVMIFELQPKEFFNPANAPARLNSLPEKLVSLQQMAVDYILIANFDRDFANLSASDFCQLLSTIQVKSLVIGDDFRFGKGRGGDEQMLARFFAVHRAPAVLFEGTRISSTQIRKALAHHDLVHANALLGKPYTMMGQVVHGDKIGRTLGIPTANIALSRLSPAVHGIWGVNVQLLDKEGIINTFDNIEGTSGGIAGTEQGTLFGCVNIGKRPSVDGIRHDWRFEVHLPHFAGDLYGTVLQITFLHFLHKDIKYPNLAALTDGIHNDISKLIAWRNGQSSP